MRARRRWAAVLLAGATGVPGLGAFLGVTALPAAAAAKNVHIVDRAFDPRVTEIDINDRVIWRNSSGEEHTVTSDSGPEQFDENLGPDGRQAEKRFRQAGTYTYHCKIHSGMTGTIEVVDQSAPPPPSTAPPTTTSTTAPPPPPPPPPPTTAPRPTTTTTTEPPTTTTTENRPPAQAPSPPVTSASPAPPPPMATSSTTRVPPAPTTTVPPTTATSAPPDLAGDPGAPPVPIPETTSSTAAAPAPDAGDETAVGRPSSPDDPLDLAAVTLISLLVAVGLFGAWTLIRVRPGRI